MTETAAAEEATDETPPEESSQKDDQLAERHGYIDFEKIEDPDLRKDFRDRFNGLYRSQKDAVAALGEMQRLYGGMEKKLADLEAAQQKKAADTQVADVKKAIADANAKGEYEKAADLTETLADLKAPRQEPKKQGSDELSSTQQSALFAWQAEMTEDGRVLRPWANPGSPKYQQTIAELTKAYSDPAIASQGFHAVLDVVHEKMSPKPKQTSPVSDGDATPPRQSRQTTKLTPQQEFVAKRMYPPEILKRIGEKDPIVAYTKALKKYGAG